MAYAALVSLSQTTDLILNHDNYSISVDEKEKINTIREFTIFLLSFLVDFPERANCLEGKIRDLANETEDIIEHFMWKQIQSRYKWVSLWRVEFDRQLNKVAEELGLIAGKIMEDRPGESSAIVSSSRLVPPKKYNVVIGLDDDLKAIRERLFGQSSKLEVIPITGMGGIGKTTLARNVYDDSLIMEHFHIRAWVSISLHYNVQVLHRALLDSMKMFDDKINISGQKHETMAEEVYKSLKGRRYLIVMDDIWSTDALDDVRNIFPDDNNGSRIMLTTRLSDVAAYADSARGPVHEMKFMDEDQSWNLLKQKVFSNGQDCPCELDAVGKQIARSCGGLPLAVVLVAGILSTDVKTPASWERIRKNVNSVVDGQLEKILSLSYTHLPHHFRPCFLFMAGFPEDFRISVSRLVKLWVGEGFLKLDDGSKSLEEEAEDYLEDLVRRSLVLVTSRKSNGKIKSCSLHDLVRDMCIRKAREEKFLQHATGRRIGERRISIGRPRVISDIWGPTIHTILSFRYSQDCSSLAFLVRFKLLRVLEIMRYKVVLLPQELFELFHLRHLAIAFNNEIPASISNLLNLQTLIIRSTMSFPFYLPLEIWKMPHLRHLVFTERYMLPHPADGSTLPLQNLQTLCGIACFVCSERVLKMIPNLKKLGIFYPTNKEHYHLHNLVNLNQLEKLKITASPTFSWQGQYPTFPRTLKQLTLVRVGLPWRDMSIVGSLPNLQVLKLRNLACVGDTWKTSDGEFPQLKYLLIEVSKLSHLMTENSHFPRLECLVLYHCPCLTEIPDNIGEIPTLEVIEVDIKNQSLMNSARRIQEDQQSYGSNFLQVRFVHYKSGCTLSNGKCRYSQGQRFCQGEE